MPACRQGGLWAGLSGLSSEAVGPADTLAQDEIAKRSFASEASAGARSWRAHHRFILPLRRLVNFTAIGFQNPATCLSLGRPRCLRQLLTGRRPRSGPFSDRSGSLVACVSSPPCQSTSASPPLRACRSLWLSPIDGHGAVGEGSQIQARKGSEQAAQNKKN